MNEPLASGEVLGAEADSMVHAETPAAPAQHLAHERLGDLATLQEKPKDLPPPELFEGLTLQLRQSNERTVGREALGEAPPRSGGDVDRRKARGRE